MRRSAAEITDPAELNDILREARVLFLGLHDDPAPYVVPVCFGCEAGTLYVHGAAAGTKIELLTARPSVGFSACTDMTVKPGASACAFGCRARSVCGTGTARVVEEAGERVRGLECIMRHYGAPPSLPPSPSEPAAALGPLRAEYRAEAPVDFKESPLSRTLVIAIRIDTLRGKRIG